MSKRDPARICEALEALYARYNHRRFVHPDPLAPLYRYDDPLDQEIVGLVTSSLAFGNVTQILRSVEFVLAILPSPRASLLESDGAALRLRFHDFRHRYVTGVEMADLLAGARRVLRAHGSLGACFGACAAPDDATILPAMTRFAAELRAESPLPKNYLLPEPGRGSACKRLFMYARWMIRRDAVDPGAWNRTAPHVRPAQLLAPMDTHLHRMARILKLTARKQADLRTALEVTGAFRRFAPDDPVRYDFALTRLGIRDDGDPAEFLGACGIRVPRELR